MKTTILPTLTLVVATVFASLNMQAAEKSEKAEGKAKKENKQEKVKKGTKLRHVVAFKFKETATEEQIKEVETAFRDLKKKIKEIQDFEWGTNNSPEKHNKGTTHGFILTFKSEEDRDIYLKHPDHEAFGKLVGPLLADVFVIDFWAGK